MLGASSVLAATVIATPALAQSEVKPDIAAAKAAADAD